ncbi:hypothetical protein F4808DRAFT_52090 [Astrocystis sublimbata]|nr:hypothetical protein F4808DRAFT_52090 [Astrocystis sublimbata]
MAKRFKLDLKTIHASSRNSDITLSMSSVAFIYDISFRNHAQEDLLFLIQSKQLWLLPRGLCRLDVHIQMGDWDIVEDDRADLFDLIADTIPGSSLWSQLGLKIETLQIDYHQQACIPNLYFGIEQPDMSSALLSPPHAHTAQVKGIECILRFGSSNQSNTTAKQEEPESSHSCMFTPWEASAKYPALLEDDIANPWENAARLVDAAFRTTFGMRKRTKGINIIELEKTPSLLELAPALWNSHYLRSTLNHTNKFAVISNILASSLHGQSPQIRRKGAELCNDSVTKNDTHHGQGLAQQTKQLESSIQQKLWDLLQNIIVPTIGTKNTIKTSSIQEADSEHINYEIDEPVIDEMGVYHYDLSNEFYTHFDDLPYQPSQESDEYCGEAAYGEDTEPVWLQHYDSAFFSEDDRALRALEIRGEIGSAHNGTDATNDQVVDNESQYRYSASPYNSLGDQVMSVHMYEGIDDDMYRHEYDSSSTIGQALGAYEVAEMSGPWYNLREGCMNQGMIDEDIHDVDAYPENLL